MISPSFPTLVGPVQTELSPGLGPGKDLRTVQIGAIWISLGGGGRRFRGGQHHGEGRTGPDRALDLDPSAMRFHDLPRDRQPESRAAGLPRPCRIDPVETLENVREVLGWDAGTGVSHADDRFLCPVDQIERNSSPGRRVAQGIVDQIEQELLQSILIAVDLDRLEFTEGQASPRRSSAWICSDLVRFESKAIDKGKPPLHLQCCRKKLANPALDRRPRFGAYTVVRRGNRYSTRA